MDSKELSGKVASQGKTLLERYTDYISQQREKHGAAKTTAAYVSVASASIGLASVAVASSPALLVGGLAIGAIATGKLVYHAYKEQHASIGSNFGESLRNAEKWAEKKPNIWDSIKEKITQQIEALVKKNPPTIEQELPNSDLRNRLRSEPSVSNPTHDAALKTAAPQVQENGKENVSVDLKTFHAAAAKGGEAKPVITTGEQAAAVNKGLQDQLEEDLRRRKAREQGQAGQGLNSVDVQRSGKELERGDFIVPRRITQAYTEVDGKFYAKDSNRVMFEDKGEKLATSTTNKETVADMVAYAKAKQWDSLKLSGSQEFRREAWLQAESQGIKTQGYTPKQSDLAALETLRKERSTNAITPLQERKAERATTVREEAITAAPRHDLNKNQAAMHVEASKFIATNMQALQKRPGMADKSVEDLTKLAYWRGIVTEQNKLQPKPVQDEALARFDKQAVDPQFLKRLNQETESKIQDKTTERVQQRDTHEQSL